MIFISHRGNINGKIPERENAPDYIDHAIKEGYDVELDVWKNKDGLFLGHDEPQYEIKLEWLQDRAGYLWIHCKNLEAFLFFTEVSDSSLNYFWHEEDSVIFTSKKYVWAYPRKSALKDTISVLPEIYNQDISESLGVCSDFIERFKDD